jgi:hypothetical protein
MKPRATALLGCQICHSLRLRTTLAGKRLSISPGRPVALDSSPVDQPAIDAMCQYL